MVGVRIRVWDGIEMDGMRCNGIQALFRYQVKALGIMFRLQMYVQFQIQGLGQQCQVQGEGEGEVEVEGEGEGEGDGMLGLG